MIIRLPDGRKVVARTDEQGSCFLQGWAAALSCYAIWNDGVQRIGAERQPIKEALKDIKVDGIEFDVEKYATL